jgi:RimJ/RimL family protein N-acetyltransferase
VEGLERIVGYILPENYVMQRICRKLGFTLRYDRFEDAMAAEIELRSQWLRPRMTGAVPRNWRRLSCNVAVDS